MSKLTRKYMIRIAILLFAIAAILFTLGICNAGVIPFVPSYNWYHGCGPTALASIMGYYDNLGYSNLFEANSWDSVKATCIIQDEISSPSHNYKYDGIDKHDVPDSWTSIADYFGTSVDPLSYGASWSALADNAVRDYTAYKGYDFNSWQKHYCVMDDQEIINEINNGRPMLALVDSSSNGIPDHFIPIFGYEYRDDLLYYAAYTTWHEDERIDWYLLQGVAEGNYFGVERLTFIEPITQIGSPNVPIPGTIWLLLGGLFFVRRRRR